MTAALPAGSQRVLAAARDLGLSIEIHQFPEGTRTAADAAAAIGCPIAAIVKSLVFTIGDEPVVALIPGDLMLDPEKLEQAAGAGPVRRATLEEVREATGYAAGGTPPFGHHRRLRVFADRQLRRHDPVWAAGGTASTVFSISPADLDRVVQPAWADLSRDAERGSRTADRG